MLCLPWSSQFIEKMTGFMWTDLLTHISNSVCAQTGFLKYHWLRPSEVDDNAEALLMAAQELVPITRSILAIIYVTTNDDVIFLHVTARLSKWGKTTPKTHVILYVAS